MKYTVVYGFHDIEKDKGYRIGDTFDSTDVTEDRLNKLSSYNNALGRPLITNKVVEVIEPIKNQGQDETGNETGADTDVNVSNEKLHDIDVDALGIAELKDLAVSMGITFSPNIGEETLRTRIKDFSK